MLRLWLIAMLAAGLLVVARDHDLMHRTNLLGHCAATHAPVGSRGSWQACHKGVLNGRPDLARHACRSVGRTGSVEYWRCPGRAARQVQ
jgi:hypothetical protein